MTALKLKENLHSMIDDLQDENILKRVNDVVCEIVEDKKIKWDSLSENEKRSIELGIEQIEKGEKTDYEDIKKEIPG